MKTSAKTFAWVLLLIVACLLALPPGAAAQRVAVLPFDIYSERDAALLRNAIYNSMTLELGKIRTIQIVPREQFSGLVSGKKADEELALSVGRQVKADYVIIGSLTQLGTRVSLDAKAVTVETGALPTWTSKARSMSSDNHAVSDSPKRESPSAFQLPSRQL